MYKLRFLVHVKEGQADGLTEHAVKWYQDEVRKFLGGTS